MDASKRKQQLQKRKGKASEPRVVLEPSESAPKEIESISPSYTDPVVRLAEYLAKKYTPAQVTAMLNVVETASESQLTESMYYLEQRTGMVIPLGEVIERRSKGSKEKFVRISFDIGSVASNPPQFKMPGTYRGVKFGVNLEYWLKELKIPSRYNEDSLFFPIFDKNVIITPTALGLAKPGELELAVGIPTVEPDRSRILKFVPNYRHVGYDSAVLDILRTQIVTKNRPDWKVALTHLIEAAAKNYAGNGTTKGQLIRLKKSLMVRAKTESWDTVRPPKAAFGEFLDKYWPMKMVYPVLGQLTKENWISEIARMEAIHKQVFLPRNFTADAGLIWNKAKQGDTFEADLLLQTRFLGMSVKQLKTDYPWLFIVPIKPKYEVNKREDSVVMDNNVTITGTKTRNYFPASTCGVMLPKTIFRLSYFHQSKVNATTNLDLKSMLGMKYFKGAIGQFMRKLFVRVHLKSLDYNGIYSDNLYFAFKYQYGDAFFTFFVSADGEKMESTIRKRDFVDHNKRLLDRLWGGLLDSNIKSYMENVHPELSADVVGIIGRRTTRVPGMPSGTAGTSQLNTYKGMSFLYFMREYPVEKYVNVNLEPWHAVLLEFQKTNDLVKALKSCGHPGDTAIIKKLVEKNFITKEGKMTSIGRDFEVPLDVFSFSKVFTTSMQKTGISLTLENVAELSSSFNISNRVFKTDLLGFDCVRLTMFGIDEIVPVLAIERLSRTIVFQKKYVDQSGSAPIKARPRVRSFAVRIMALWQAYIMGGWFYSAFGSVIKERINQLYLGVKAQVHDYGFDQFLLALDDTLMAEFGDERIMDINEKRLLASVAFSNGLPTPYVVFNILCDQKTVDRYVKWVVNNDLENWDTMIGVVGIADKHLDMLPPDKKQRVQRLEAIFNASRLGMLPESVMQQFLPAVTSLKFQEFTKSVKSVTTPSEVSSWGAFQAELPHKMPKVRTFTGKKVTKPMLEKWNPETTKKIKEFVVAWNTLVKKLYNKKFKLKIAVSPLTGKADVVKNPLGVAKLNFVRFLSNKYHFRLADMVEFLKASGFDTEAVKWDLSNELPLKYVEVNSIRELLSNVMRKNPVYISFAKPASKKFAVIEQIEQRRKIAKQKEKEIEPRPQQLLPVIKRKPRKVLPRKLTKVLPQPRAIGKPAIASVEPKAKLEVVEPVQTGVGSVELIERTEKVEREQKVPLGRKKRVNPNMF